MRRGPEAATQVESMESEEADGLLSFLRPGSVQAAQSRTWRNDGYQRDQEAQRQAQAVAHLLAGSKTMALHAWRVHHPIHRSSAISVEGRVDLVMFINKISRRRTACNLPAGTGGGEAGCSTGTGGAGAGRDSGGGDARAERSCMVSLKSYERSRSRISHLG